MLSKVILLLMAPFFVFISESAYAVVVLDCNNGGRYEDMGDGTVQDCRTGLIWLQDANCKENLGLTGIDKSSGNLNWHDAKEWIAALESGYCGLNDGSSAGDWRLPNKSEWMAMIAYARKQIKLGAWTSPALTNAAGTGNWTTNGDAFNNVQSAYYWSSTLNTVGSDLAWIARLTDGDPGFAGDFTSPYYVWPVRGGQSGEFGKVIIQ